MIRPSRHDLTEKDKRELWAEAHIRAHFPRKRWGWRDVGWVIVGFGLAVWLWYEGLN